VGIYEGQKEALEKELAAARAEVSDVAVCAACWGVCSAALRPRRTHACALGWHAAQLQLCSMPYHKLMPCIE
jgi:hypothetical protein